MKICYVLNSGSSGGVEQHVLDLTRGMVARGHDVYVVCPWGEMVEKYFDAGAEVHIDSPKLDIDPFYIIRLARFLKKKKPDVFHVHMLKTVGNGLIASKIFKLASFSSLSGAGQCPAATQNKNVAAPHGAPKERCGLKFTTPCSLITIAHIHTPLPEWQITWWKKKIDIFFNRIVTNWAADVVMALTESRKRVKVEGEGIDPEKIVVIPNGVSVGEIKSQSASWRTNNKLEYRKELGVGEDTVLVGTLSRLTVEKGVEYLIDALSKLSEYEIQNTRYKILIGGSGELKDDLKEKARDLGLAIVNETGDPPNPGFQSGPKARLFSSPVQFLGFVPEEEKWDYLNALDIFVFPSLAEGFGISLIEAMAAGTACLASDLEVLQEVGGDAVQYFETKNPEDLAEKLAELINNEEKRRQLASRAKKRVEQEYSMENFWDRYENLYCTLL